MIICHDYKFIFLKTNKTAGTSIEIALSKFCGPDDIITPIAAKDEKARRELAYRGPQNYVAKPWNYSVKDVVRLVRKGEKKLMFYNHITAEEARARIEKKVWDEYFKFCFERNPWDRVVSLYYWRCRTEPRPTISEFVDSGGPLRLKRRGYDLYTIDGQVAVDRICRFEHLTEELEVVRTRLGIPEELQLPHAKAGFRADKKSYRDILDDESKAKIATLFSDEIRLLGYEF